MTLLLGAIALAGLCWAAPNAGAESRALQHAAVAENPRATREALRQLQQGGNAVDAAVTAALVAGVVSPTSSGIGGGCFINYFDPAVHTIETGPWILDARETAPAGLIEQDFDGKGFAFEARGKWVGTPGEVAGLYEMHRRFGKRSWSQVVMPAVRAAEQGFEVSPHLARLTQLTQKSFAGDPSLKRLWLSPLKNAGSWASTPRLGATLRKLAQQGPKAFYEGPIAAEMVESVRAAGGWLSSEDLKGYQPRERTALHARWNGMDVFTMPPPSAAGLMLLQTLGLFSAQELEQLGHNTPAYQHALAEAIRGSFADRMRYVGDPELETTPLQKLLAPSYLQARRAGIALQRTRALPRYLAEEHGTHHLITADAEGRVVALTTTVNRIFGAKITAPKSGVVMNDELDDFATASDVESLGIAHNPNRPRPGARPVSSMTPSLFIKDGQVVLAVGGSGGMNIGPEVTQAVLARLAFNLAPAAAVAAERFQVPFEGASLLVPPGTPAAHRKELERRGELVADIRFSGTAVQMLAFDGQTKSAGADPRKFGLGLVETAQPAK